MFTDLEKFLETETIDEEYCLTPPKNDKIRLVSIKELLSTFSTPSSRKAGGKKRLLSSKPPAHPAEQNQLECGYPTTFAELRQLAIRGEVNYGRSTIESWKSRIVQLMQDSRERIEHVIFPGTITKNSKRECCFILSHTGVIFLHRTDEILQLEGYFVQKV